jgi:hypothetical protein
MDIIINKKEVFNISKMLTRLGVSYLGISNTLSIGTTIIDINGLNIPKTTKNEKIIIG